MTWLTRVFRPWHQLHNFPRKPLVTCFPPLAPVAQFPAQATGRMFPALGIRCMYSAVKAMLHEAIFPATFNATKVALPVAKTMTILHFCNDYSPQVAACNQSNAACTDVFHSPSLRCKFKEKLPRTT